MNLELKNIILVANPCHVTPYEHEFWRQSAAQAKRRGWHLVEVATRALPVTVGAQSVSLPARLSDIFAKLPAPKDRPETPVPWAPIEYLSVLEDWESRRWDLKERLPAAVFGLLRLVDFVDDAIHMIQPSVVLTTNKIDHGVSLFREAGLYHNLTTKVVERSPLDSIWLEPDGLFGESAIWSLYSGSSGRKSAKLAQLAQPYLAKMVDNPHGFRASSGLSGLPDTLKNLQRPIFFLPMDNVLWTGWEQFDHPMRAVDNPLYPSPRAAMEELLDHAQSLGGSLVVKRHPACLAINESSVPNGAFLVEGDLSTLLAAADVVLTFNTKVAFPALALGRPVVTLAPNPVAACGATYHCQNRSQVSQTLREALAQEKLKSKLSEFPPFVGWLASEFFYDCRERPSPDHRGPHRFVDDLIAECGAERESLDEQQIQALARDLRRLAAARPVKEAASRPPQQSPPASGPEQRETLGARLSRRLSASMAAKAIRTLRQEGARELARKSLLWILPRLGKRALALGAALLERAGVKTDELKAKLPYLVQYRRVWIPTKAVPYAGLAHRLWHSPPPVDSDLTDSGCSPAEEARLQGLQNRYAGFQVLVLGTSEGLGSIEQERIDQHLTFAVEEVFLDAKGAEPNFYITKAPDRIGAVRQNLESSEKTLFFLPQSLFGLLPANQRIFWFGEGPVSPQRPRSEGLQRGFLVQGSASQIAVQLAQHFGCKSLFLTVPEPLKETHARARRRGASASRRSKGAKREPIVIDFDIKRLVDASVTKRPYQGITRYTLRLFETLRKHDDAVLVRPVYLHPLDPQRIGTKKAVIETFGLDAVSALFGEDVNTLWERRRIAGTLLRFINGLERRFGGDQEQLHSRILGSFQKGLVRHNFGTSETASIAGQIFHSPVNPLPPRRLTRQHLRVVTVHDCIFLKFPEFHPNPGRVPAIRKTLDSIDPKTDFVICDSENSRRDVHSFIEIAENRTTVVPLTADPQFFQPDMEKARKRLESLGVTPGKYLVALAQSEPRKNIPRMVEAYLRFQNSSQPSSVDLVLVTWEDHRRVLYEDLQSHGLISESIKIITEVDDATLSGLYALAIALVYVPLYEGFGIPPLEAMAAGCPVIVADNSSLPEVAGEAGVYVDAEDVADIAAAIHLLVTDPAQRSHRAGQGLSRAASFSWDRVARMTIDFYRRMTDMEHS